MNRTRPVALSPAVVGAGVGLGADHTCAVTVTGNVNCWGRDDQGQLGNGAAGDSLTPGPVGEVTDAVQVVASDGFTCARSGDGSAWCWGDNQYGQLGNGTNIDQRSPVVPRVSGVADLALGSDHACAALVEGSVRCWGRNERGQLARSEAADVLMPTDVTRIEIGRAHV